MDKETGEKFLNIERGIVTGTAGIALAIGAGCNSPLRDVKESEVFPTPVQQTISKDEVQFSTNSSVEEKSSSISEQLEKTDQTGVLEHGAFWSKATPEKDKPSLDKTKFNIIAGYDAEGNLYIMQGRNWKHEELTGEAFNGYYYVGEVTDEIIEQIRYETEMNVRVDVPDFTIEKENVVIVNPEYEEKLEWGDHWTIATAQFQQPNLPKSKFNIIVGTDPIGTDGANSFFVMLGSDKWDHNNLKGRAFFAYYYAREVTEDIIMEVKNDIETSVQLRDFFLEEPQIFQAPLEEEKEDELRLEFLEHWTIASEQIPDFSKFDLITVHTDPDGDGNAKVVILFKESVITIEDIEKLNLGKEFGYFNGLQVKGQGEIGQYELTEMVTEVMLKELNHLNPNHPGKVDLDPTFINLTD